MKITYNHNYKRLTKRQSQNSYLLYCSWAGPGRAGGASGGQEVGSVPAGLRGGEAGTGQLTQQAGGGAALEPADVRPQDLG